MVSIALGIDNIYSYSQDSALLNECASILEKAGHTVHKTGVGPNVTQSYMLNHTADWMVQIAGGMCIGSTADFCYGIKQGYYHAKKACIPLMYKHFTTKDPYTYVPRGGAWDDNFSHGLPASWFNQFLGQTFPETYKKFSQYLLPYSPGKTAQEMMNKMLSGSGGTSTATGNTGGGGGNTAFDLIKQVVTPWDKYGVMLALEGNTLTVTRATTKNAPILHENIIVNDSISITDYASDTPNYVTDGKNVVKDDFLIERFGQIQPDENPKSKGKVWLQDMYQVAQRESGHTIDMKVLFDPELHEGMYVHLQLPSFELDGYYFVSKTSVEEENCISITLDPAPPSRYQETSETTVNTNTGNASGKDMISIGNDLASKYSFCALLARDRGAKGYITNTYADMKKSGCGDCWAWSDALYTELNAAGIKTRIIQYRSSPQVSNHRSVQVWQNGKWEDYPYRQTNISQYARNTTSKPGMYEYRAAPS